MAVTPGTRFGRYEIRSLLGAGGMAEVYLAWDTQLDRSVAIKILPAAAIASDEQMRRFVQEAKAVSALNHPNILTIYEIGHASSETHFIATEFIDGSTLRRHMAVFSWATRSSSERNWLMSPTGRSYGASSITGGSPTS